MQLCTKSRRCHGLVPWSFTLAAKQNLSPTLEMPRDCPVEFSRSLLFSWEREPPRGKPVASSFGWQNRCSVQRKTPRGKPVASSFAGWQNRCSVQGETPRGKPVASSWTFCAKPFTTFINAKELSYRPLALIANTNYCKITRAANATICARRHLSL